MRIRDKIKIGKAILGPIFFKTRKPVMVSWEITRRCNLHCRYCESANSAADELDTSHVLSAIKELSGMGARAIRFTGGEPLVREDIAAINAFTRRLGILTALASNGLLFCERIDEIKEIDSVSFSLEGEEKTHDALRGEGTHGKVMEAIEAARKRGIDVSVICTLNALNLDSIQYLIHDIGRKFKVKVFFQPATRKVLYAASDNPVCPDALRYKDAIQLLLSSKKSNRFIGNSVAGLQHLYHWPHERPLHCVAGRIICRLDSRGNMTPCPRLATARGELNVITKGAKYCFDQLDTVGCRECWCSLFVELNTISQFRIGSVLNALGK